MRVYRVLLSALPYAVILIALAAARLWWWFGVAAVATVAVWGGTLLFALRARERSASGRPITGPEVGRFFEQKAWLLAIVLTVIGVAAFYPGLRTEAWWVVPLYAATLFVIFGVAFRFSGRWGRRYEEEVERFSKRAGHGRTS